MQMHHYRTKTSQLYCHPFALTVICSTTK